MKKLVLGTILLALAIVSPIQAIAGVNVNIGIALPPPVVFEAPPDVIVLPDTNDVYVVPDSDADLYFWDGWWWRPWEGRWYRSHYYNRGWSYYSHVPSFYYDVDPGWRTYYRQHNWNGHRWNYERIPDRQLRQNWRTWKNKRHWERQRTWGVQSYKPRPQHQRQQLRNERQKQYHQRPEVQRHQQQMREQPGRSRVQKQQRQHVQPQGKQRRAEPQHKKSQGEHGREGREQGR